MMKRETHTHHAGKIAQILTQVKHRFRLIISQLNCPVVAQLAERWPRTQSVVGLNPTQGSFIL